MIDDYSECSDTVDRMVSSFLIGVINRWEDSLSKTKLLPELLRSRDNVLENLVFVLHAHFFKFIE